MVEQPRGKVRSFVLRQGRLTKGQASALEEGWPRFGLELETGVVEPGKLFGDDNPLVLEIGFGMGDSLVEQALAEPETNFIGIEVHRPGVGHLLNRLIEHELKNVRVFAEDSLTVLKDNIRDHGLQKLQLFFPDPWPKKRHHKRRIVNDEFLNLVVRKLERNGILHIATDWAPYAEAIEETLGERKDFVTSEAPARPTTKFERRGLKLGHQIFDLAYRTNAD